MKNLDCFPCKHMSVCCTHGSSLLSSEAEVISAIHGNDTVQKDEDGNYSTVVKNGTCVFSGENCCTIHSEKYYPLGCSGFPFKDNSGNTQSWDDWVSECPESKIA